jgi:hypothetical protein
VTPGRPRRRFFARCFCSSRAGRASERFFADRALLGKFLCRLFSIGFRVRGTEQILQTQESFTFRKKRIGVAPGRAAVVSLYDFASRAFGGLLIRVSLIGLC